MRIGIKKVAEKVIKGGAIIDATDVIGRTPLHYAAENGNVWSLVRIVGSIECMNQSVKSRING